MKSRLSILFQRVFTNALIGCTLLTLLTPTSLLAGIIGSNLSDADYLNKFGTSRRQQTCPSRSEPRTGRLSVDQAIKYARCWFEEDGYGLNFVDFSNFQLSPPRRATGRDSIGSSLDRNQPVYDIKAYAVSYHCTPISRVPDYDPNFLGAPGKNCSLTGSDIRDPINSNGVCYKNLNERWTCRLGITDSRKNIYGPPPAN
jgi:hypothetical protein